MKVAASFLTVASAASVSGELRLWLASLFVPAKLGSIGRKIQHEEEIVVQSGSDCEERLQALPPDIMYGGMQRLAHNWRLHGFKLDKICKIKMRNAGSTFQFLDFTTASDIGRSHLQRIVLTIALLYHFILIILQLSHPRCRTASAARADRPPLASRSTPRRLMLPAASALDVPRPLIPARAAARRALRLIRQRALVPHAVPPASKCRLTEMTAAARHAVLVLTVPFAPALRAVLPPIPPTAHVRPVPPRPMLLDARVPLAPGFPNK